MRLLNRLNQYQRLWQPSAGETQHVTVSELAERCFCSERHLRTLLRQAQQAGWLRWEAQSGRGCIENEELIPYFLLFLLTAFLRLPESYEIILSSAQITLKERV
ncbi:SgrR family transcriptional regulator, partial [Salmonella enterica subsp. enterica serovar Cerro]|nr:SgrR family transcriptional regulator [Salmonella enterica subsp. enterica serovar Cerro]